MGNFKSLAKRSASIKRSSQKPRSVIRASVGKNAENLPSDIGLIAIALKEAKLLAPDTPPEKLKNAIVNAIRHVGKSMPTQQTSTASIDAILPADHTERTMRRAISEMRYPLSHQYITRSSAPRGVREALNHGVRSAQNKAQTEVYDTSDGVPAISGRAVLPAISLEAFQSNRRIAETMRHYNVNGIDELIAERIRLNGKVGFVDIRDFFSVLKPQNPMRARILYENVKRRLNGKSRRRFIKLIQGVSPTEDDFIE